MLALFIILVGQSQRMTRLKKCLLSLDDQKSWTDSKQQQQTFLKRGLFSTCYWVEECHCHLLPFPGALALELCKHYLNPKSHSKLPILTNVKAFFKVQLFYSSSYLSKPSLKIGTANAICWNPHGVLLRDYDVMNDRFLTTETNS